MVRTLTDPDGDDTLEWQERVVDVDGDSVSIDLILDQVDDGTGFSNAADSNPSWLGFTTTTNTINTDEIEVLVDITADTSGLNEGYTYRFEITADDGITKTTRTFVLEIVGTPPPNILYITDDIGKAHKFEVDKTWDISTLNKVSDTELTGYNDNLSGGVDVKPDGTKFFVGDEDNGRFIEYVMSDPNDLSSLTMYTLQADGNPTGVFVRRDDGSELFGNEEGWLIDYQLSTNWTISDGGSPNNFVLEDTTNCLCFSNDGINFYYAEDSSRILYWKVLDTAWAHTGSGNLTSFDLSSDINGIKDIALRSDGEKMLIASWFDGIAEYTFSTPFDPASRTFEGKIDLKENFNNIGERIGGVTTTE